MATNNSLGTPNYSRWQAMARGAGYGRTDDFRIAQAAKEQTDEKDFSNLDRAVSELDTWKVQIQNDWADYNQSLTDPTVPTKLPEGFVGTAKDYENAYFQARRNFGVKKNYAPSDIQRMYGKDAAIKYENLSGLWGTILGDGKFMNPVTSEQVDTDFGSGINYQVRTVDPQTGQIYDANPTFGGKPVAQLQAEGGDAAVQAGSWPPIPDAARDEVFFSNVADLYQRVPGASSAVRTVGTQDPNLQGFVPGRVQNELAALQAIREGSQGVYDTALQELQGTQAAYRQQEVDIDTQFAKDKQEERARLIEENEAMTAQMAEDAKNAAMAERNPQGTGYGITWSGLNVTTGGGFTGQGPIVIPPGQQLPMGDELYNMLPDYVITPDFTGYSRGTKFMHVPDNMKDYIVPRGSTPLNMTNDQHKSLTSGQRTIVEQKNEDLINRNLQKLWRDQVTLNNMSGQSALRTELKEYRETDVPGDISAVQYDKVANDVEAFYENQNRRGNKNKFWEALRNSPDDLALFRESPFRFAEKYMNDDAAFQSFIGLEPTTKDIDATPLPQIKSQADIDAVINAMERPTGTLMPSHIAVLEAEVARLDTLRQEDQQAVADFIDKFDGNMQQVTKEDKAATWLAVASTFHEGDPRGTNWFKSITEAGPSLIERGRWDDFTQNFQQNERRLAQQDRNLTLQEEGLDIRWEELGLNKSKFTQEQLEFQTQQLNDARSNITAWRNGSQRLVGYKGELTNNNFYKMLHNTAGVSGGSKLSDYSEEEFASYIGLTLGMLDNISLIPKEQWGVAEWADYAAVQSDVALGMKTMLRKMSQENISMWRQFLSFFGADYQTGPAAFDTVTSLVAFDDATEQPTEDPAKIAYYMHVDPRTMQELGNKIPATQMDSVMGPLGGREALLALSLGNHKKYRELRGIK